MLSCYSSFAIILIGKREPIALPLIVFTVNVLWILLTVPWVGLQSVVEVFPDHLLLNVHTRKFT